MTDTANNLLHILRNPHGWSDDAVRAVRLAAADEIVRLRAELKAAAFCDARCSWVEHHPGCVFSERDALRNELDALKAAPPSVPEGWQLVPVEPTEKMLSAGRGGVCHTKYVRKGMTINEYRFDKVGWSNMLAAAPKPGEEK